MSGTVSPAADDDEVRRRYERYQLAERDEGRQEIAFELGELDGRRHGDVRALLEDE